jgi:hypothetical protein
LESAPQERAEQLKVKHDMKEKWKKREMGWHELMLKDTKALIALENDKVKAEYQKRVIHLGSLLLQTTGGNQVMEKTN